MAPLVTIGITMIKELIKIANKLDLIGLTKEADELDNIIREASHSSFSARDLRDMSEEELKNRIDSLHAQIENIRNRDKKWSEERDRAWSEATEHGRMLADFHGGDDGGDDESPILKIEEEIAKTRVALLRSIKEREEREAIYAERRMKEEEEKLKKLNERKERYGNLLKYDLLMGEQRNPKDTPLVKLIDASPESDRLIKKLKEAVEGAHFQPAIMCIKNVRNRLGLGVGEPPMKEDANWRPDSISGVAKKVGVEKFVEALVKELTIGEGFTVADAILKSPPMSVKIPYPPTPPSKPANPTPPSKPANLDSLDLSGLFGGSAKVKNRR